MIYKLFRRVVYVFLGEKIVWKNIYWGFFNKEKYENILFVIWLNSL